MFGRCLRGLCCRLGDAASPRCLEGPAVELPQLRQLALFQLARLGMALLECVGPLHLLVELRLQLGPFLERIRGTAIALRSGLGMALCEVPERASNRAATL